MTKIRFQWVTDEGYKLDVEAYVDDVGELQEWDASLNNYKDYDDISFVDRLTGAECDDITQAAWNEYDHYLDDRGVRV